MTTPDRRAALVAFGHINGIDFVELDPTANDTLVVSFVFNLFDPPSADPSMPTVPANPTNAIPLGVGNFGISGGERITSIAVNSVSQPVGSYNQLSLLLDPVSDFSVYTLTLQNPGGGPGVPAGFDPQSASASFIFHVECAKDFDCALVAECPPPWTPPPPINYLVKDYPGFRQTMLDRMSLLAPGWQERNAADLGVAVVETLAYIADHLSYRQDVVATEAYLGTARLRTSIRRHARLVDYHLNEGSNARAWLRITVNVDGIVLGQGTTCATLYPGAIPPRLAHATRPYQQAIDGGAVFFETMADSPQLYTAHAEMGLYNWSNLVYCLAPGTTQATLDGAFGELAIGMVLILAEKLGPLTGDPADADVDHRQAVRLTAVAVSTDPVGGAPITEIAWSDEDALTFPLCVASIADSEHHDRALFPVSVAWGNVVLADQGRSVGYPSDPMLTGPEPIGTVPTTGRFWPALADLSLTFAAPPPDPAGPAVAAVPAALDQPMPVIEVFSDVPDQQWGPVADLLAGTIDATTPVFVPEIETDGTAHLLFGDSVNGEQPVPGAKFTARYRVGNGTSGNVARDAIVLFDSTTNGVVGVSNPLPAWGGVDPETVDHVRQSAPVAFRTQERAVTPADYVAVASTYPGVQRAAATLRWTGSWTTVFLTIERTAQAALDDGFIDGLEAYVDRYRMAGFDLAVEDGMAVPLYISMQVCVRCGYVATDVQQDLLAIFSNQVLPDGTLGMFSPSRLDLGEAFYLSPLYAAAQSVDGVASVEILRFERQSAPGNAGLLAGVLTPQRLEFFVLDNDPNFPERGRFDLTVGGGL